jgi:hypothetical protein
MTDTVAAASVGPQRFAPTGERPIEEQIGSLTTAERECFDNLTTKWAKKYPEQPFTDQMILRFARCSPGTEKFNEKASWKVMKKFDRKYLDLKAAGIEDQLLSKVRANSLNHYCIISLL